MSSLIVTEDITIDWNGSHFLYNNLEYSAPLSISTSGSTDVEIKLTFSGNISSSNAYIIINSDYIIINGEFNLCTIENVTGYNGLVHNESYTTSVKNIIINSINSTLSSLAGWICQQSTNYTTATYCASFGTISESAGGIFGGNSANCVANKCYSNGLISESAGGIFAANCQVCTAQNCYSSGFISRYAGGIFGESAENCDVITCYTTGTVSGHGGGIFGQTSTDCSINKSYVSGTLTENGNPFFGRDFSNPDTDEYSYCEESGEWNNTNASILTDDNSGIWLIPPNDSPFALLGFNKQLYYELESIISNSSGYISSAIQPDDAYIIYVNDSSNENISIDSNGVISYTGLIAGTYNIVIYAMFIDGRTFVNIYVLTVLESSNEHVKISYFYDKNVNIGSLVSYKKFNNVVYSKKTLQSGTIVEKVSWINKNILYLLTFNTQPPG